MKHVFYIVRAAFLLLLLGYFSNTQGASNKLSCAFKSEQQFLGALPEFSSSSDPLLGYQCELTPHYSSFLGNWFPSQPYLYFSQTNRSLTSDGSAVDATNDDSSKTWRGSLAIKRFGQSQLSIFAGQKDWQQVFKAKEVIAFIPASASTPSDAIAINEGQQARINRKEESLGFSFIFPFQTEKVLTELRLQQSLINQPIQANITPFNKRSLFPARAVINEIMIISHSSHRGLNFNWHFGLGKGEITLEPENSIVFESKLNQIISLRAQLEIYYHHRFNRRWFSHITWQGGMHYWQQNADDDDFQLASGNTIEQNISLGIGFTF